MSEKDDQKLSRRGFLKGVGTAVAAASIPVVAGSCQPEMTEPLSGVISSTGDISAAGQYPAVPPTPMSPPQPGVLRFFTPHEAQTVEALTARILPGTPEDPGAREAGVVNYIDNMLSYQLGFAEPTYREPPYAETYQGDAPPSSEASYQVIWVAEDEVERYGYQSILTPREVYRLGVAYIDSYARTKFSDDFVNLSEEQQDSIIGDMVDGKAADSFERFSDEQFFQVLRRHSAEGMFSDPAYGGNRDMVGWQLLGYPGAQRAYTETELRTERYVRAPQDLAMLHGFNPGEEAGPFVILPVSGAGEHELQPQQHWSERHR